MGFFSFLTGDNDTTLEPAKGYVPEGYKVRRKGEDFWRTDEKEASADDEIEPIDRTPTESPDKFKVEPGNIDKTHEFQRKRAQLGDFAKKQATAALDQLEAASQAVNAQRSGAAGSTMPAPKSNLEAYRQKLQLTTPDNYAKVLEQAAEQVGIADDRFLNPTADAVLNYKRLTIQDQPGQAAKIQSQLAAQDLPGKQARAEIIDKELEQANKDLQIAATNRQAQKIKENIRFLNQQRLNLGNLEQQQQQEEIPQADHPEPVSNFMKGLGVDKETLTTRVHAALNRVGIPKEQWGDQDVDPSAGMMRVLSEIDPSGKLATLIASQLDEARQKDAAEKQQKQPAPAGDESGISPERKALQEKIEGHEQRMRQLYAELRQSPFMHTWPGIILYVLVGVLTQNPAFAARLIGGVGNRNATLAELKGLQFDLHRLDQKMSYQDRMDIEAKREAARRLQKKDDVTDQRKWELSKLMLQHQLIIKRNAARGNPETFLMKKLSAEFQRNLAMAAKFQGTMQNEFADPKDRAEAKNNWSHYMRKAAELDQQIKEMGGAAIEQPAEAQGE